MTGARVVIAAAIGCAACQGQAAGPAPGDPTGGAPARDAPGPDDARTGGDARGSGGGAAREPGALDEEMPGPGRVIAELGAIPAWQAVVDRAQLLGRRGQHGVVYGRVGPQVMVPAPVAPAGAGAPGLAAGGGSAAGASVAPGPAAGGATAGVGSAGAPGAAVARSVAARGTGAPDAGGRAAGALPVAGAGPGAVAQSAPGAGSGSVAGAGAAAPGARPGGPAVAGVGSGTAPEPHLIATPYVWLIDDAEGNGALGIRIALGDKAKQGDRIAAGGAWQLDAERRWYWKPDAIQPLPPAPPSEPKDPPPPVPGHAIATGPLPPGARTAGVARDGDAIYFQIVGPSPQSDGDGWQVADQLGSPTALVLNLPGERASYGGQDMRAPDERWQLRRGQTYWVRIGVLHRRTGKPPTVNARTAPVRVP